MEKIIYHFSEESTFPTLNLGSRCLSWDVSIFNNPHAERTAARPHCGILYAVVESIIFVFLPMEAAFQFIASHLNDDRS